MERRSVVLLIVVAVIALPCAALATLLKLPDHLRLLAILSAGLMIGLAVMAVALIAGTQED